MHGALGPYMSTTDRSLETDGRLEDSDCRCGTAAHAQRTCRCTRGVPVRFLGHLPNTYVLVRYPGTGTDDLGELHVKKMLRMYG